MSKRSSAVMSRRHPAPVRAELLEAIAGGGVT